MSSIYDPYGERWFSYFKSPKDLFDKYKIARQEARSLGYNITRQDEIRNLDRASNVSDVFPATYPDFTELNQYIEQFNEYSAKIDSGGAFEKERLRLSEDKRFLFSFALASKGLIRIPEYYSEDVAKKFPKMFNSVGKGATDETMVAGVVDINMVQSFPLPNGKPFFFVKIEDFEYPLRQQQKGTAKMLEINSSATLIEGDDGMFYTDPTTFKDFSLKFSSSFKKSYIEIPKSGGKGRYVDLYIPFDMLNDDLDLRLTSCIPLLLASKYFQEARIKVRINIMRPIITKGRPVSSIMAIPIKDFNDPIDFNQLAVLRGIYNVGKNFTTANGLIQQVEKNKKRGNRQVDMVRAYASELLYNNEIGLQNEFARYKNWFRNEVKEGRIKSQLVDKPLMLTFSTEGILSSSINNLLSSQRNSTASKVRNNFFEILDVVDLYYNKNISKVVKRIKDRFDENDKNRIPNPNTLKNYLLGLAGKLYRDLEPTDGMYASTKEELDDASKKYNDLLKKLKVQFEKFGIL